MLEKKLIEAKTEELLLEEAVRVLGCKEEEIILEVVEQSQKGLLGFGSKLAKAQAIPMSAVCDYAMESLIGLVQVMGIEILHQSKSYDSYGYKLVINTSDNGVLIGKNGRTLKAIQAVLNTVVRNEIKQFAKVSIDIGEYQGKRIKQLERLAYKLSREVAKTRVDVKLDSMNSYERRILHEYLANDKFVETVSEGEEPNRCVVIKYKKNSVEN